MSYHPHYQALLAKARQSHTEGRSPHGFNDEDIARAQLYCYAFRRHTIGAFHATRILVEEAPRPADEAACVHREYAILTLRDLGDLSMEILPRDFRIIVADLHRYEELINRALTALDELRRRSPEHRQYQLIHERFLVAMNRIRECPGIELTKDNENPEQCGYIVPGLGITIYPLVYGDYHSWNLAWLGVGGSFDVPAHKHDAGVEIHLGYGPMKGHTIVGDCYATVEEGYAMPIPPQTAHGYINDSDLPHHVPFIFGSLKHGGWGVFLDVEPTPVELPRLHKRALQSRMMNQSVFLEREIAKMKVGYGNRQRILIPAAHTDRNGSGGLCLRIGRVAAGSRELQSDSFMCISIVSGSGKVCVAGVSVEIQAHDHFGVPPDIAASIAPDAEQTLIYLISTIERSNATSYKTVSKKS